MKLLAEDTDYDHLARYTHSSIFEGDGRGDGLSYGDGDGIEGDGLGADNLTSYKLVKP